MIRTVSRYMNDLYTHKVSRKLKDSLIPSPTRAELSWSHFTGSKMPLAAHKNHTHTDELDIKFFKRNPINARVFEKPYFWHDSEKIMKQL